MDQNNQLTQSEQNNQVDFYNEKRWKEWLIMAETFVKSGALPQTDNTSTLMMKLQAGYEMGMTPLESVKSFYFVKGVMNIFGSATVKRIKDHGWKIKYEEKPNECTAIVTKGEEKYSDTLTFSDAEKSHWTSANGALKAGWYEGANRKMKLRYGVLSMIIKTHLPEVMGSAIDIKEVAEDTVPVIQGEIAETPELDGVTVDKIMACQTKEELITLCREIKAEKGMEYYPDTLKFYNIRKQELEEKNKTETTSEEKQ